MPSPANGCENHFVGYTGYQRERMLGIPGKVAEQPKAAAHKGRL